jgi:hypothetical protein
MDSLSLTGFSTIVLMSQAQQRKGQEQDNQQLSLAMQA